MLKNILFVVSALALARAQIPSLGWCPEYVPMANFDIRQFTGVWYEIERSFQIFDAVSRCVRANYTLGGDGKYRVSNEVTNRFTGVKRVLDGEIKPPATKADEGKLHVTYTTVPLTPATQYAVLETDYKNYAVMWTCSGLGLFNAQNAWVMTRSRIPSGEVLQKAYGVLDKYKIAKTFFVKTNQEDCAWFDETPAGQAVAAPESAPAPVVAAADPAAKNVDELRSAVAPDTPVEAIVAENVALADEPAKSAAPLGEPETSSQPQLKSSEPIKEEIKEDTKESNFVDQSAEPIPVATVPQLITQTADRAKEIVQQTIDNVQKFDPIETIKETFEKPVQQIQAAFEKPVDRIQETFERPIKKIKEIVNKPIDQIKETFQKPLATITDILNIPAPAKADEPVLSDEKPAKIEEKPAKVEEKLSKEEEKPLKEEEKPLKEEEKPIVAIEKQAEVQESPKQPKEEETVEQKIVS